jgi:heat shock protein HtpX
LGADLLRSLEDDELMGVVAHEVAHLKNHDSTSVVQAVAMIAVVLGVAYLGAALATAIVAVTIAICAAVIAASAGAAGEEGGWFILCLGLIVVSAVLYYGFALLLLCVAVFGCLTIVAGAGIRSAASAVSQAREYLADASAAQWTRSPERLATALRKLSGASSHLSARALLLQPLLLQAPSTPLRDKLGAGRLMALLLHTHPRIESRIARLEAMVGGQQAVPSWRHEARQWTLPLAVSLGLAAASVVLIPRAAATFDRVFHPARQHLTRSSYVTVGRDVARLRAEPSTAGRVLSHLRPGQRIEVLRFQRTGGVESGWYEVRSESGRTGWVAARLVSLDDR